MKKNNDLFRWNTSILDAFAKWAFVLSAVASCIVGGIELLYHRDFSVGVLGMASALAGLAGAVATDRATKKRDRENQYWRSISITTDPPSDSAY